MGMHNLDYLREELRKKKLDAFLVPMADAFQNEYIPPSENRVCWLTGFSGSTAFAMVSLEKAALFVDGRYETQAQKEVNAALFEILPYKEAVIHDWLSMHLSKGKKVGFDPWLHTYAQYESFKKKHPDLIFEAIQQNPVDVCWEKRPVSPLSMAFQLPFQYAGEELLHKIKRVSALLKKENWSWLFVGDLTAIAWLLNIRGADLSHTPVVSAYAFLNDKEEVHLFTNLQKFQGIALGKKVTLHDMDELFAFMEKIKNKKIALPRTETPLRIWENLKHHNEIVPSSNPLILLKAIKNQAEREGAQRAHIIDGAALTKFLHFLDHHYKTLTEETAADALYGFRVMHPAFKGLSFPTISAFGANAAMPHYHHPQKNAPSLKGGGIYLVDSGGQYFEGTTDVTRTVFLGRKPPQAVKHMFTLVLKGHIALARARFPKGTMGHHLDGFARQFLWVEGRDFAHGTGHGVGSFLNVHEGPCSISQRTQSHALDAGMILSNEPGYYEVGAYGIRLENLVLVKKSSFEEYLEFEILTLAPFDHKLVLFEALDPGEKAWLKTYHMRVLKELKSFLDADSFLWLQEVSSPFLKGS